MEFALKNRSGVSLAEICVAMAIIAFATLMITTFSRNTYLMSRDSRACNAASLAAEDKISELSTQPYAAPSTENEPITIDNIAFQRSWTVSDAGYIKKVIVTITYTTLKGKSRTFTFAGAIN